MKYEVVYMVDRVGQVLGDNMTKAEAIEFARNAGADMDIEQVADMIVRPMRERETPFLDEVHTFDRLTLILFAANCIVAGYAIGRLLT